MLPETSPTTQAVHDATVAIIKDIPDEALAWQPGDGEWSLKHILAHISGTGEFFRYIVERAQSGGFSHVALDDELRARMGAFRATFAELNTTGEMLDSFERSWHKAQEVMAAIPQGDLDREFTMQEGFRPGEAPRTVTLRKRVVEQFGRHLADHEGQLRETLARWRAAHAEDAHA